MKQFSPCDALKPYIQSLMVSESQQAQSYTVLPGTSLVMGFQYRGRLTYQQQNSAINLATAGITGILNSYRIFENTADTGTLLVIFKEAGAAPFFNEPLHELYNESLSLDNLVAREELSILEEQLSSTLTDEERVRWVEQFLLSRLQPYKTDLLVSAAIEQIHLTNGLIRMDDLAEKLYTSKSPLEKRFRQVVGTSPKKFATIIRMKSALITMQSPLIMQNERLLGYYDQSHFIHDFRKFTGTTPEQYLKRLSTQK
ncbi:MAG: helix-turn-helix transcriptional regulator [Bacteroidetes bacterium]|jgi:AraC-like DNA-binding protein|nr:helix-turn-helix transcriptional regulator [Bacteroidota bacterium]